jgi:hypothetical protein
MAAATMGGRIGGIEPPPLVALQGQYQPLAATVNRRRRKQGNGVTNPRIIRLTADDVDAAPGARPICSAVAPSAVSSSGGKATRTSGAVLGLSDPGFEVSRGGGRAARSLLPVRTKVSRFRGERVGRRTVALRLSPTWLLRCLLRKQICGLHDYGYYGEIPRKASPRAKSGGARETELREPQSGRIN